MPPAPGRHAVVTCGGLCPGLNDVVQGLVSKLTDYGVPDGNIMGIKWARGWLLPQQHQALSAALSPLLAAVCKPLGARMRSCAGPRGSMNMWCGCFHA